jgi:hypothetical protein
MSGPLPFGPNMRLLGQCLDVTAGIEQRPKLAAVRQRKRLVKLPKPIGTNAASPSCRIQLGKLAAAASGSAKRRGTMNFIGSVSLSFSQSAPASFAVSCASSAQDQASDLSPVKLNRILISLGNSCSNGHSAGLPTDFQRVASARHRKIAVQPNPHSSGSNIIAAAFGLL